jgi:hypothetical protein
VIGVVHDGLLRPVPGRIVQSVREGTRCVWLVSYIHGLDPVHGIEPDRRTT